MGSEIASGNNSLVVYDVYRQTTDVAHDLKVLSMISVDLDTVRGVLTEVDYPSDYIGMISKVGRVDATPTVKVWESPVSALGEHSGRKMLREIRVRSTGDGTLTLWLDGKNYEYALSNGMNRVVVMRLFDRMRVTLTFTTAEARVTTCELTVDHYGE